MSGRPSPGELAELLRLPAVLTVPGDVLAGAAAAGERRPARLAAACASSSLLYLAGMALNDWADRDVDAEERPGRPIPSGRVDADDALRIAAGLTGAGIALGTAARRQGPAVAIAGAVWLYDLGAKGGATGPPSMALARALNVLSGAPAGRRLRAGGAATLTGLHTLALTQVSAGEVHGGTAESARFATAATGLVAAGTAVGTLRRAARSDAPVTSALLGLVLAGAHAAAVVPAQREAADRPSARNLGRLVGRSILGLVPLQASVVASSGQPRRALALGSVWPAARALAARRSVT